MTALAAAPVTALVVLGVAVMTIGQSEIIYRVVLIAALLLLTTPVASHVIGRAAYLEGEVLIVDERTDESERRQL